MSRRASARREREVRPQPTQASSVPPCCHERAYAIDAEQVPRRRYSQIAPKGRPRLTDVTELAIFEIDGKQPLLPADGKRLDKPPVPKVPAERVGVVIAAGAEPVLRSH